MPLDSNYLLRDGQNLFDVATLVYGSPEYAYQLLLDNSGITAINSATTQYSLAYDSTVIQNNVTLNVSNNPSPPSATTYSTYEAQSLFDLALQVNGDVSTAYQLMMQNGFRNMNANVFNNTIALPNGYGNVSAQTLVTYVTTKGINFATAYPKLAFGSGFSSAFDQRAFH